MPVGRRTLAAASLAAGAALPVSAGAQPAPRPQSSAAAQAPAPQSFAQVTRPADGVIMPPGYARAMAQFAYIWGWPMVNQFNRRAGVTQAPAPGRMGDVLPVAPRGRLSMLSGLHQAGARPSSPARTRMSPTASAISRSTRSPSSSRCRISATASGSMRSTTRAPTSSRRLGKPYGTQAGLLPARRPELEGQRPRRHHGGRAQPDRARQRHPARLPRRHGRGPRRRSSRVINQIVAYPLAEFDGTMKTHGLDANAPAFPAAASSGGETPWVLPERFFDAACRRCWPRCRRCRARRRSTRIPQQLVQAARPGPRDQAGADARRPPPPSGRSSRTLLPVAPQRPSGRQWLEPLEEQRPVRRGLLQSHRHGEVEHVRQQPDRDAVFLHRPRPAGAPAQRRERLHGHLSRRAAAAGAAASGR